MTSPETGPAVPETIEALMRNIRVGDALAELHRHYEPVGNRDYRTARRAVIVAILEEAAPPEQEKKS